MNLDRSITKSPEELTSIWYDVMSPLCPLKISSMMSLDLLMVLFWQYHLGRWHIRITMKASHFIVCWSNKQPSGNNNIISFVLVQMNLLVFFCSLNLIFLCLMMYQLQPLLCYSMVERKWLHYNVCSRFVNMF